MTRAETTVVVDEWTGCYRTHWTGSACLSRESSQHPAKFSRSLVSRIYLHLAEDWSIPRGSIILDPFGGVACGAWGAREMDYRWIGVELERHFAEIGRRNIERLNGGLFADCRATLLQGDSRRLVEVLLQASADGTIPPIALPGSVADLNRRASVPSGVVASPPFVDSLPTGKLSDRIKRDLLARGSGMVYASSTECRYGETPGQLGAVDVDAAVSSPPFPCARQETTPSTKGKRCPQRQDPEAIAVVSSPPYETAKPHPSIGSPENGDASERDITIRQVGREGHGYGSTSGQLGACVSSPPYEGSAESGSRHGQNGIVGRDAAAGKAVQEFRYSDDRRGENLGGKRLAAFWTGAAKVLAQVAEVLPPGAPAVWVVKPFVRDGKLVDFPGDWERACEAAGLRVVHRHRCPMTDPVTGKRRCSFFRTLHEKRGSPVVDAEWVICTVRG